MALPKGQNPNRPAPGSQLKVEPIRDRKAIKRIKKLLEDHPRDVCLFTLGINTAYRASELLSITAGQVRHLQPGDVLDLKQKKTKKYRPVPLNTPSIEAIDMLLQSRHYHDDQRLFIGQRGPLTVPTVVNLVKRWCADVGLPGQYGSHTLRKTWGYWQRVERNTPVPLLMEAYGHATQRQTLEYLGIQSEELHDIYSMEL